MPTLADVLDGAAPDRAVPAADAALPLRRRSTSCVGAEVLRQAREPPAGRRVQGARRRQPRRAARRRTSASAASSPRRPATTASRSPSRRGSSACAATICVPEDANPVKVASMRGLGAELVFHGRDFDDAREHCERLAAEHGYRYVHSANEPALIAGVGTEALEILEQEPRHRGDRRPDRRRQRRRRHLHRRRRRSNPAVPGDRRPVGAAPAAYRSWRERRARRGPHGDVRRGPRHAHAVRAAAADPARARSTTSCSSSDDEIRAAQRDDDRDDAQPDRGGRRVAARRRVAAARRARRASASR